MGIDYYYWVNEKVVNLTYMTHGSCETYRSYPVHRYATLPVASRIGVVAESRLDPSLSPSTAIKSASISPSLRFCGTLWVSAGSGGVEATTVFVAFSRIATRPMQFITAWRSGWHVERRVSVEVARTVEVAGSTMRAAMEYFFFF